MSVTVADRPSLADQAAPAARSRSRSENAALAALLVFAAALYLWNLGVNGWANGFYSGAVKAMTANWTAFFFGSTDAGNTITVDKPPASLWVMALSARVFGLSSWSILVPQALIGVGSVALLYAAVRRVSGSVPALVAGFLFALTPVVVLMFRYNNPDALLVLLMVGAAYAVVRAVERAGTRWLLLAGVLLGFAFLTKTAQALLPLPAFALAYLWAAPTGPWRRIGQLLAAGAAMVVAAGWWFLGAALWPTSSRPYIGGSTDGTAWQLAIGYNGLGRLFGEQNSGGGMPSGGAAPQGAGGAMSAGMAGGTPGGGRGMGAGWLRMFGDTVSGQVSWLLPAALLLLVAALVLTARTARTDRVRASLIVWGGWTLVTGLTFSLMQGIFHEYYTVALAPGIAATVAIGAAALWRRRDGLVARITLAVVVAATGAWCWVLLGRADGFLPWLRWVVVAVAAIAAVALVVRSTRLAFLGVAGAVVAASLGPVAYAAQTLQTGYSGGIITAGPASAGKGGGPGGGAMPGDMPSGGAGAMFGKTTADIGTAMASLLKEAGTQWSAATENTSNSADLALGSGTDVMGIGGFTGGDPAPTLARFKTYVSEGRIGYYVTSTSRAGGPGGGGRGDTASAQVQAWVKATFTAKTVGNYTVYALTGQ